MRGAVHHSIYDSTGMISVRGTDLHVLDRGTSVAGRPTVVLLHGFGSSLLTWRRVLDDLSAGHRVVAFDRPGLGRSPVPPAASGWRAFAMTDEAELTVGVLDELDIDTAVLIGSSAGGAIAIEVADRAPERIRGLVLADAAVLGRFGPPKVARRVMGLPGMSLVGPAAMATAAPHLIGRVIRQAWHEPDRIDGETRSCAVAAFQAEGWAPALWKASIDFSAPPVADHARAIDVPTLVVSGDDDRLVPLDDSRRLAATIPGARLEVITSCGHLPHEEQPAAFCGVVVPFVNALSEPAALRN